MNEATRHTGRCFCGSVEIEVTGEPEVMGYCHCESCRRWAGAPIYGFTVWQPSAFAITRGADDLEAFGGNPLSGDATVVSKRIWCKRCGGHVYVEHPVLGLVDVPAVILEELAFAPAFHIHYQETVHPMRDGLPKFRDFPAAIGGSGVEMEE
jgi:hypothetical protein